MENKKNGWVIAIVVIAILALIGSCSGGGGGDDRTCAWCNGTGYNGNGAQTVGEYVFRKTPCKHCGGDGIR